MERQSALAALTAPGRWDVLVIGGGAVGLGIAVEAAARGYRTTLLERSDFAAGTSSRSTKLIHGGLRYLPQGRIALVREALRERNELLAALPELVHPLPFLLPCKRRWQLAWYGLGVGAYSRLSGSRFDVLGRSAVLSAEKAMWSVPNLRGVSSRERLAPAQGARGDSGLIGAVQFHDAQFDDARFAMRLASFAESLGAVLVNYVAVDGLLHHAGRVCGAAVRDAESGKTFEIESRAVINAAGPFADSVRRMDDPGSAPRLLLSRGSHVVLPGRFLGGTHGLILPQREGRVHFTIPWYDRVLVGTTEVVLEEPAENPQPSAAEIESLLAPLREVLVDAPGLRDVTSAFAGIRALVRPDKVARNSAGVSREHSVVVSASGLISVLGGKWTLYRKVASEAVDAAAESSDLRKVAPMMPIPLSPISRIADRAASSSPSHQDISHFVQYEMARTVDDVLSRRTRAAFLDVHASLDLAPKVAARMAELLQREDAWIDLQVQSFRDRWDPVAKLLGPRS